MKFKVSREAHYYNMQESRREKCKLFFKEKDRRTKQGKKMYKKKIKQDVVVRVVDVEL